MILYSIMDVICLQGIDGSRARVVFIQNAKCADRKACTMGHAGSEYVYCLKCSHCCVYVSDLELLQPVTPGNPLSRPHWPASGAFELPEPGDQMTLVWPSLSSTQMCNFLDSFKLSMAHFYMSLLTDLICNDNSFQILGFTLHPCMFCYLYSKHKAIFGEIWWTIMAIIQIVPNYLNSM